MRTAPFLIFALLLCLLVSCSHSNTGSMTVSPDMAPKTGEAAIVQSWNGDYPVLQLYRLPEDQRSAAVGVIADAADFKNLWQSFKPGEPLPEVDFNQHLVIFSRNTQFFNRIRISRVNVADGVAEVLAMETMSALPIEDNVAMSLVVVPREGIRSIQTGNGITIIK